LKAVNSNGNFDYIRTCVFDIESLHTELSAGIHALRSKNIQEGLAHIGATIQTFATKSCQISDAELNKLKTLTTTFTTPKSVEYTGKSLLINNVEVIAEAMKVVKSFEQKDFSNLGFWIGKTMHTVALGLNQPLRQEVVDYINSKQSSWTAEVNPKFAGMTMAEIKNQYLGALNFPDYSQDESSIDTSSNDIPTHFNSSEQWPGCIHPIRDQAHCGSCWAFAASEVLSDRFCIASNKQINVVLSPQYLVSCNALNHGCNGGVPLLAWNFVVNTGLVTDSCWPYESGDGHNPGCKSFTKCHDGQPTKMYHGKKKSITTLGNPKAIQENIMKFGPVEAAFSVYEDFISYKSGIYKHTSGSLLGGHAVKIVGWGNENGTNFWIVANSWNTTWGESGFFRIAFGQCGIDKSCSAVEADLSSANEGALRFFQ